MTHWSRRIIGKLARAPVSLVRTVADSVLWPSLLKWHGVTVAPDVQLRGCPEVRLAPGGSIRIGKGVKLFSRRNSNPLQLRSPCAMTLLKDGASITIGAMSALSGTVLCAATSIDIGENVLIGANCAIVDTDFHPLDPGERRAHPTRGARSRPIRIGDDVFIGTGVTILKGSVIGQGCVVGAGAVVAGTFPAGCVIAGNPAVVIRELRESGAGNAPPETAHSETEEGTEE